MVKYFFGIENELLYVDFLNWFKDKFYGNG